MKNILKVVVLCGLLLPLFNVFGVRKYPPFEAMRRATTGNFDASEKNQILADLPEEWKKGHKKIVNEIRTGQRSRQAMELRRKKAMERVPKKEIEERDREDMFSEGEESKDDRVIRENGRDIIEDKLDFIDESDLGDKEDVDQRDNLEKLKKQQEELQKKAEEQQLKDFKEIEEKKKSEENTLKLIKQMHKNLQLYLDKFYNKLYERNDPSEDLSGFTDVFIDVHAYDTSSSALVNNFNNMIDAIMKWEKTKSDDDYIKLSKYSRLLTDAIMKNVELDKNDTCKKQWILFLETLFKFADQRFRVQNRYVERIVANLPNFIEQLKNYK